jgi:hypothetical protein
MQDRCQPQREFRCSDSFRRFRLRRLSARGWLQSLLQWLKRFGRGSLRSASGRKRCADPG